jgi:hypothetical protein
MKFRSAVLLLFHTDRWTDGRGAFLQLLVAIEPKNSVPTSKKTQRVSITGMIFKEIIAVHYHKKSQILSMGEMYSYFS